MLATVDVLSGGRLTVGCGVGWMREEFEVLETPPYEERGLVGDEYISAFRELWTSDSPEFDGTHVNFSDVTFAPKPVQQPHPPIWIGGESPPALRRAGRLGDAWYPIGSNPKFTIRTPAQYAEAVDRIRSHAERAGRDPDSIDLAYSVAGTAIPASSAQPTERRPFTGAPSDVAEDIAAFRDVGVRHMKVGLEADCLSEMLDNLAEFATDVMPLVPAPQEKK
jgi:probable F420-dependent oxidoreductase